MLLDIFFYMEEETGVGWGSTDPLFLSQALFRFDMFFTFQYTEIVGWDLSPILYIFPCKNDKRE